MRQVPELELDMLTQRLYFLFMIASLSPTDSNFQDRGTLYCHCEANFYSSKAYYISTMLCSWPVLFLEATFIVICSFFLTGMDSNGGLGFLYFWCMAIVISFCGTSISRVLSYALPSNDIALALGPAVFLVFFNMTAGFAPQHPDLPNWLRWLSLRSPCAYAFEGILLNELHARTIQARTFLGLNRYNQASVVMKTPESLMAFDVYMIVAFTVLFDIIGCIILNASRR